MILPTDEWCSPAHKAIRIPAIDYLYVMAPRRQFIGQLLNKDRVSAKSIGRVKSGHHTEAHRKLLD
jgi:hypothetical protein